MDSNEPILFKKTISSDDLNIVNSDKVKLSRGIIDYKYPTFNDAVIDDQLKYEITIDTLLSDLTQTLDSLDQFLVLYQKFLKQNKSDISKYFVDHNLSPCKFEVIIDLLKREVMLISFIVKLKFIGDDEIIREELNKSYKLPIEIKQQEILNSLETLNKEDQESIEAIQELIKRFHSAEDYLLSIDYRPSITNISIALKVLNRTLELGTLGIKVISSGSFEEEHVLDFLLHV